MTRKAWLASPEAFCRRLKRIQRKHGITFEEAVNVFGDPYALFEQDRTNDETGELR
jgi:uncharacterized DUF497 family protein